MPPKRKSQSPKRPAEEKVAQLKSQIASLKHTVHQLKKQLSNSLDRSDIADEKVAHLIGMLEDSTTEEDVYTCVECGVIDKLAFGRADSENDCFYCRWCMDKSGSSSDSDSSDSSSA